MNSKLRIKLKENEIEIEGDENFIEKYTTAFYKKIENAPAPSKSLDLKEKIYEESTIKKSTKEPSPAEYYKSLGKTDGISQILIFAKYLELNRSFSEFSQKDINSLAKEAKLSKDIHGQYFSNAVKQGLLRSHGKGKYSLTLSAEDLLNTFSQQ